MPGAVLAIVHQRDAGPGVFAEAARARGVALDTWLRAEEPSPPRDIGEYRAVLALGGDVHPDQEDRHPWLARERALLAVLVERGIPLLAVCLGAQLLAAAAGAPPRRADRPEIGWYGVEPTAEAAGDPLIGPLAPRFLAFEWHSYEFSLPPGATPLARSSTCLQAFRVGERAWGIQFHAEVTRADLESWIDGVAADPDAVRLGVDQERLRRRSRAAIGTWNDLGRDLFDRFLAAVP